MVLARIRAWFASIAQAVLRLLPVGVTSTSDTKEERGQGAPKCRQPGTRPAQPDELDQEGNRPTGGSRTATAPQPADDAGQSPPDIQRKPESPAVTIEEDGFVTPTRSQRSTERANDSVNYLHPPDARDEPDGETPIDADTGNAEKSDETEEEHALRKSSHFEPPVESPSAGAGAGPRPSRRVPPEKRGGRPRVSADTGRDPHRSRTTRNRRDPGSSRAPRPELVCWKEGVAWKIGVEVPEDLGDGDLSVIQDGEELEQDAVYDMRWPLSEPLGSVEVQWFDESDAASVSRIFESSQHRLFKVAASGDKGRAVSQVTRGHYIVTSPRALRRDDASSGPAPLAPEYVLPETAGVVAHHFLADTEASEFVLRGDGGAHVTIRPSSLETYRFEGHLIEDAHPTAGPLFGREPPHLVVGEPRGPAQVVVGLEGQSIGGRPRYTAASFEELRNWFDDHQPGWFFVRLYDANGDLLDSLDFRYAKALEGIEIDEFSSLPPPEGHRPARVRLRLGDGLTVRPLDGPKEISSLSSLPTEGFVLPARPDAGEVTLNLHGEREFSVDVIVKVPRVWWALTSTADAHSFPAWVDRPLALSAGDFLPTSPRQVSVLLPEPGWAHAFVVGFRDSSPKRVPILRTERRIDYPLRNLGGDEALVRDSASELLISLETAETRLGPVAVGQVMPDSKEKERDQAVEHAALSCPRLMSTLTRMARSASPPPRRAVRFLRETYYRPSRRGGQAEKREFLVQGLSLLAALLERGTHLAVPRRRRRQAEQLAAFEPSAVAGWQLRLRRAEYSTGWKDLADLAGKRQ